MSIRFSFWGGLYVGVDFPGPLGTLFHFLRLLPLSEVTAPFPSPPAVYRGPAPPHTQQRLCSCLSDHGHPRGATWHVASRPAIPVNPSPFSLGLWSGTSLLSSSSRGRRGALAGRRERPIPRGSDDNHGDMALFSVTTEKPFTWAGSRGQPVSHV